MKKMNHVLLLFLLCTARDIDWLLINNQIIDWTNHCEMEIEFCFRGTKFWIYETFNFALCGSTVKYNKNQFQF